MIKFFLRLLSSFARKRSNRVIDYSTYSSAVLDLSVIPGVILALFLTDWLNFAEFVLLDTAFCNKIQSDNFLASIRNYGPVFPSMGLLDVDKSYEKGIEWMVSKGCSVHLLSFLNVSYRQHFGKKYFKLFSRVRHLHISGDFLYYMTNNSNISLSVFSAAEIVTLNSHYADPIAHLKELPNLTEMNIANGCPISDRDLMSLVTHCPQLTSLGLEIRSGQNSPGLTEDGLCKACAKLNNLVKLNVNNRKNISGVGLFMIFSAHNNAFEDIRIAQCVKVKGELIHLIVDNSAVTLLSLDVSSTAVTAPALCVLMFECINLVKLNASKCDHVIFSGDGYRVNENLKELIVSESKFNSKSAQIVATYFYSLQHFEAFNCPDLRPDGVNSLANALKCLRYFDVGIRSLPSQVNVQTIAKFTVEISTLIEKNPLLHTLKLGLRMTNIDGMNIALVASHVSLVSVDLSQCGTITDNEIIALSHASSELTSLNISGCSLLTDVSLQSIAENCRQLKEIDITKCNGFSLKMTGEFRNKCDKLVRFTHMEGNGIVANVI